MSGLRRPSFLLPCTLFAVAWACAASAQTATVAAQPARARDIHPITSLPKPHAGVLPVTMASVRPADALSSGAPAAVEQPSEPPVFSASAVSALPAEVSSSAPYSLSPVFHDAALHAMVAAPPPPPPARPDRGVGLFSALAIGVKLGVAGIGFDVATPLAQRLNLRGGASFFSYTDNDNLDGQNISGQIKFRSVNTSLDFYPFNNRFRISPGVIVYNGNHLSAASVVPGGQSFSLGDQNYTSSTTDPIHGSADFSFGNKVAPSLTIGFGNMIPRHGNGHWSIPFEVGAEYISKPTLTLNLAGTACQGIYCQSTANPQFQASLQQEESEINSDIAPLRFFPILSLGVAYKF